MTQYVLSDLLLTCQHTFFYNLVYILYSTFFSQCDMRCCAEPRGWQVFQVPDDSCLQLCFCDEQHDPAAEDLAGFSSGSDSGGGERIKVSY